MTVPTFGGRRPDRTQPIEFRLQAAPATGDGQLVEKTFHARANVNFSTIVRILSEASGGLDQINRLMAAVLLPDDAAAFRAMVDDPDLFVDADALSDATAWLLEQYGERPTVPSSDSSPGRTMQDAPPTSEVKPYSPATV